MRILHVTDTYAPTVGGIEVLVRTLAESQAVVGLEVTVLTCTPDRVAHPCLSGDVEVCRDPRALHSLVSDADVVHGHVSAFSPLALRGVEMGARADAAAVASVHSVWGSAWPLFRAAAAVRGWTDLPIQWAAVSEVAAGPVGRALPGHDVLVVPNAVDTGFWAPQGSPRHTDVVTVVAVMRMAGRKRPLALVDVLERMRALVPGHVAVRAVLVGDGPLLGSVRRRLDQRGMSEWVRTPGDVSHAELRELYRRSQVFVSPSTHESFGLAALEARAAGLAVVARSQTGIAEFLADGVEGLLADSDSGLAEHLAHLCVDEPLRGRIVAHNHAHRPALDWSCVRERTTALYLRAGALDIEATHAA
ncbi:glycosyltransferase family 4 protein [Knoellia sp. Soil729]|uniref:glycosyltransferase family 4 protein n=1 Tax=Knoellia sp. Soil729 TaxID=1736394 RepID=UPI0006FC716D|nr:glycosyltransferase family 4 protein [Knoellia sp. Soil729]KRE42158.1 hypothetical protein ASG74_06770 [Knoellia sp. Soil729]